MKKSAFKEDFIERTLSIPFWVDISVKPKKEEMMKLKKKIRKKPCK